MALVNENYLKLPGNYLFSEIAKRVAAYTEAHPDAPVIRLGIGDVTQPLPPACIEAMHKAVDEMAHRETFRGYGPEQGYSFLTEAIVANDYAPRGIAISADEVFVSDGSKSDTGNIGDIFGVDNVVAVTDPVYPVYVDTNVMGGRSGELGADGKWSRIVYMPCTAENHFIPQLPSTRPDIIYLCVPNNPTGTTINRTELKKWVDYARENKSVIFYDAAYEAYITEEDVAHSIYEIDGALEVAIEFRSFSKNAGFTGTRCGFCVIPHALKAYTKEGAQVEVHKLWNRRHTTKFNGTPYIVQRGAEAAYSPEGKKQIREMVAYYMENARLIREGVARTGLQVFGGVNAPYIWLKTPNGMPSWDFFDLLLSKAHVVGTPGVGFGPSGEGYFRLTAFGSRENTAAAVERLEQLKF